MEYLASLPLSQMSLKLNKGLVLLIIDFYYTLMKVFKK